MSAGWDLSWLRDLLGHGVASRQDLPLPFEYALIGAGIALIISFVALGNLWREPRIHGGTAGRPVPGWLAGFLDGPGFRWALRILGLVVTGYVVMAAWFGPDNARNPTAGSVYVLFWVGLLVVSSLLFGPVWRLVNPLRTLHLVWCRLLGADPTKGAFTLPDRVGYWIGAFTLGSFVWLELVAPERSSTETIRVYAVLYAGVMLMGAALFGSGWFSRADGFEVFSSLFGRLSVLGRRDDGIVVLRSPLAGLDQLRIEPGLVAVVAVMLGSTAYDGLSNAPYWVRFVQGSDLYPAVIGTIGLVGMTLVVAVTFVPAVWWAGRAARLEGVDRVRGLPDRFAPSVVPIAMGYVLAHYYSLLILAGHQAIIDLSDPLGTGANWLGTGDWKVDQTGWLVTPSTVAVLQVVFIVGGHILGVVMAHERAITLFPRRRAIAGQIPLLILMVAYTLGGLTLLFAT